MSKNPAWNAYNESVREINEAYEQEIKPLRQTLSIEIRAKEKKYDDQIEPLVLEKRAIIDGLKAGFQEKVKIAEEKRKKALQNAQHVLQAEVKAFGEKKAAEKAAAKEPAAVPA